MNETEKRLRIYRALTTNPEWVEILQDALSLQEREEAEYAARESTSLDNAEYIAKALWQLHEQDADVRQCVQIARLSRGDRQRIDEVLVALRKYGA